MTSHLITESTLPPNSKSYPPERELRERLEAGLRELCKQGKADEDFSLRVASQFFEKSGLKELNIMDVVWHKEGEKHIFMRTLYSYAKDGDHLSLSVSLNGNHVSHDSFFMPDIERRALEADDLAKRVATDDQQVMSKDVVKHTLDYMRQEGMSSAESPTFGTFQIEGDVFSVTRNGELVAAYKADDLDIELSLAQVEANRKELASIPPNTVVEDSKPAEVATPAEPAKAFDLSNMMAAAALPNSKQPQQLAEVQDVPAQPKVFQFSRSRPDFSAPPAKAPEKTKEPEAKLTSDSPIIRLEELNGKFKFAHEAMKTEGPGKAFERKAYSRSGRELLTSYEMNKDGNVIYTEYDGSKREMTFAEARKHELDQLSMMTQNAITILKEMSKDSTFTLRQGDATYYVKNGFFCQKLDSGAFKKEPLSETQERWYNAFRQVEAKRTAPEKAVEATAAKQQGEFGRMADRAASITREPAKTATVTHERSI